MSDERETEELFLERIFRELDENAAAGDRVDPGSDLHRDDAIESVQALGAYRALAADDVEHNVAAAVLSEARQAVERRAPRRRLIVWALAAAAGLAVAASVAGWFDPPRDKTAMEQVEIARELRAAGKLDAALGALDGVLADYSDLEDQLAARIFLLKGQILFESGAIDEAIDLWIHAGLQYPEISQEASRRIVVARQSPDFDGPQQLTPAEREALGRLGYVELRALGYSSD